MSPALVGAQPVPWDPGGAGTSPFPSQGSLLPSFQQVVACCRLCQPHPQPCQRPQPGVACPWCHVQALPGTAHLRQPPAQHEGPSSISPSPCPAPRHAAWGGGPGPPRAVPSWRPALPCRALEEGEAGEEGHPPGSTLRGAEQVSGAHFGGRGNHVFCWPCKCLFSAHFCVESGSSCRTPWLWQRSAAGERWSLAALCQQRGWLPALPGRDAPGAAHVPEVQEMRVPVPAPAASTGSPLLSLCWELGHSGLQCLRPTAAAPLLPQTWKPRPGLSAGTLSAGSRQLRARGSPPSPRDGWPRAERAGLALLQRSLLSQGNSTISAPCLPTVVQGGGKANTSLLFTSLPFP